MGIPVVAGWTLVGVFALLAVPSVYRLVRAEGFVWDDAREIDVTELLMVLAMVAMVSPLGGPIPAAGWMAVLVLLAGHFLVAAIRGRRCCAIHHTIAAVAMLYMIVAMPGHGMASNLAVPALGVVAAGYFSYDALLVGGRAIRNARVAGVRDATFARPICRAVMGAGMAYLFVASAV